MRPLRSFGYRTDVALTRFDGIVEDRGGYLVLRTPSNPTFHWGNYVLFPDPPKASDVEPWLAIATSEFPNAAVPLLAWDAPDGARGELDGFFARGFTLDTSSILTAGRVVVPPRRCTGIDVAPIVTSRDWREAAAVLVAAFTPRRSGTVEDLSRFVHRQLGRYVKMQNAGIGQWYLARVGGEPAATLGLVDADGVGRFQLVGTDPRFGRRGVCSTLVHEVARAGLERFSTLVMAADAEYHAARVYESVGFQPTETLHVVLRRPPAA